MTERLIIAGSGGQGIMLLGKVLAEAAMREDKFVTWLPAYGAEVRGGTAYCMVVISDKEISSPFIDKADSLILMNEPSFLRFHKRIKSKGLSVVNSSLVKQDISDKKGCLKYPFSEIAERIGNIKVANMVALGCYLAQAKIVQAKTVLKVIAEIAPAEKKDLIKINQEALLEGMNLANGKS